MPARKPADIPLKNPILTWTNDVETIRCIHASTPRAAYNIDGLPKSGNKANAWWLFVTLTDEGGADPMIKTFTIGHYKTPQLAKVAAEIYDVGLVEKAARKKRRGKL